MLFEGRNESSRRTSWRHASSPSVAKWATPVRVSVHVRAAQVLVRHFLRGDRPHDVRAGDVHLAVPWVMKMKSVIAGEYTPPPAAGPMITEICGTTPEAIVLRMKMSP